MNQEIQETKDLLKAIIRDHAEYVTRKFNAILDAEGGTVQELSVERKIKLLDDWLEEFVDTAAHQLAVTRDEANG